MKASFLLAFMAGFSLATSNASYILEVLFVVEPQVVGNYMDLGYDMQHAITNIEQDFEFFLHEVNRFFKSMSSYVDIEIRSKKLQFVFDDMFYDCKSTKNSAIEHSQVLDRFTKWLVETNAYNRVEGFDLALLYTGYDLRQARDTSVIGSGHVRKACNREHSVATAEFDGIERTALTTAHVIAFSIGAENDPEMCKDGFLMKEVLHIDNRHIREFSQCSTTSIVNFIRHLDATGNNCLLDGQSLKHHFELSSMDGRDILDVESVCQRAKRNVNSYFCQFPHMYNGLHGRSHPLCHALYCAYKGNSTCVSVIPTEGMICDEGKRCHDGQCLPAPSDFPVGFFEDSECLHGDSKSVQLQSGGTTTCKALILDHKTACYKPDVRLLCCDTCKRIAVRIHDCEFGDKASTCDDYSADFVCSEEENRKMCCEKCRNWTHGSFIGKRSINETIIIEEDIFDDVMVVGRKIQPPAGRYAYSP